MSAEPNHRLAAARRALGLTQEGLADLANTQVTANTGRPGAMDSDYISKLERGVHTWPGKQYRRALREVLSARTDADLGFYSNRGRGTNEQIWPNCSPTIAVEGTAAEFTARISVESPVPTRIGWTDVHQVRATTRVLAAAENLFGGGLSCEAAAGQLRWASRLADSHATTAVRNAMFEAVGNLAGVVAFSAFDIGDQKTAAECFTFALWCAEQGESWALRAATLSDMSRQAVYLGNIDEALSKIEFAQVRADRLSATGRAMIWTLHARLLAILGHHAEARTAVHHADGFFADRVPEADPPWLGYYNAAEHQGSTARALTPLALAEGHAGEAAERSRTAIRLHTDDYPRSRTFSKVRLAILLMTVGDPREAAAIGQDAAADATSLHSRRIAKELLTLDQTAQQHAAIPEVAGLRSRLKMAKART